MDYTYSSPQSAGGTLHLPSPSHALYNEQLAAINKIRRSLSRSPSRSQLRITTAQTPVGSPRSALSAFPVIEGTTPPSQSPVQSGSLSANSTSPTSDIPQIGSTKKKFQLRRTTGFRSSPRINASHRSPMRRALSENSNSINVTPFATRRSSQEENQEGTKKSVPRRHSAARSPLPRLEVNDGPIRFEFGSSHQKENQPFTAEFELPGRSSPLKRDVEMNMDGDSSGSPNPKRRSIHSTIFGSDADFFAQATDAPEVPSIPNIPEPPLFSSPTTKRLFDSPARRPLSLRRSTLQQRQHISSARKPTVELRSDSHESLVPPSPFPPARGRKTPDNTSATPIFAAPSPQRSSIFGMPQPMAPPRQMPYRTNLFSNNPHPLSQAITSSSSSGSASGFADIPESPSVAHQTRINEIKPVRPQFTRSLPIGATRPTVSFLNTQTSDASSFATPDSFKTARPLPAAFMSTGLLSKRNRDVDFTNNDQFASYAMPDTPSKRNSFPPVASPIGNKSALRPRGHPVFGRTSLPYGGMADKTSPIPFGKRSNLFGKPAESHSLVRQSSFASIDGDEENNSPTAQRQQSQSSADDLPPTPTKPASKAKENSLRSSLFGRRVSLGPDTFMPPPSADLPSPTMIRTTTPVGQMNQQGRLSPHTPQDSFMPPDPSTLSISGGSNLSVSAFKSSLISNGGFPPATPTAPRDSAFPFGPAATQVIGVTKNDVDTSLTSRFEVVSVFGMGEFSCVYKVEKALNAMPITSPQSSPGPSVWAVKKTKKPYAGQNDRRNKLREVEILQALRGNDHIINLVDSWELNHHLYIQTEFCEDGNLKEFLAKTGFKGRLDDFRIWKILLELSLGVKYIHDNGFMHLDLKPANIFIDFEGVLKIGDFGLATTWPSPKNVEMEGDRQYIGPEILVGKFDKPADVFALGMILLEIAGNIILPDNGVSWQRLRQGDMSDLPSLTWSSECSLPRNISGEPIDRTLQHTSFLSFDDDDATPLSTERSGELIIPPNFMVDPEDHEALDKIVQWMIFPDPAQRPVIDQVFNCQGVQWVMERRRAGATIYEGNWGPSDDVLGHGQDVDMMDV